MKLKLLLLLFLAVSALMPQTACASESCPSLIPLPKSATWGEGQLALGRSLTCFADAYPGDSLHLLLQGFARRLAAATGITTKAATEKRARLLLKLDPSLPTEGYTLKVDSRRISIGASRPAGFFYALQTLLQLLPSRSALAGVRAEPADGRCTLPQVSIADSPSFAWRGFMLDESRHFFGKEEVKRVLDVMARYKMNRFHWHLTDDQGWRIEIKSYPRLTSVGAWRDSKALAWGDHKADGQRYGGFYTQQDIREIVAYAHERFIEIVPEIDLPGHSEAAVAAYPELLSCDTAATHGVWQQQGVSTGIVNVANPRAVEFAKDVVDELCQLFPFGYLHLGGDECPTVAWEKNALCQQRLAAMGSSNWRDLQLDFYRQLQDHIARKAPSEQRQLIFWNEVLGGNTQLLAPGFTVMAWVGADKAAREAASRGLSTILTPQIPYYINRRQSTLPTEPHTQGKGTETVEAVYAYEPLKAVPEELQGKYMGVQANFWTEWVEDAPTLEYLMLPRLAAVAEAAWTEQTLRQWPDFLSRLQAEAAYYQLLGLQFGRHCFPSLRP